ncbi:RcpC/CpaB family pilus assembly protein, partial [Actinoallomurus acaciae]
GRTLSGPVRRGEPLTDARLRSGGLLGDGDPAAVATPIRLADAAVARLLHPGDRVDVLAARSDTTVPARTVVSSVPILAVPKPGLDPDEGALIVVRTDRSQAAALARASTDSRLSITILGR